MAPVVSPLTNRRVDLVPERPGLVQSVSEGSFAERLGLRAGDRIIGVNGRPVIDFIDFQFHAQSESVSLFVDSRGEQRTIELDLEGDEYWGLTFSDATFDGVRICENACPFCFIKQIPKGMRKSLYVMDDDYRYSMLYGSFVTLTNLSEDDWQRIEGERISPLHVSVHATDPDLRVALVGNPKGARIMDDLQRLEEAGIDFHVQLVLCPGVNDGLQLDRTLSDLNRFQRLLSIAGVPVGLTRVGQERQSKQLRLSRACMRNLPGSQMSVRRYERHEAQQVLDHAARWQRRFRQQLGRTFFYLGDEFYLMTGRDVPPASQYDGYPQIEDGIGITRHLLENLAGVLRRSNLGNLDDAEGIVVCGTLIGPTIERAVDGLNERLGTRLQVQIVENRYFGPEINVSGLLTGQDIVDSLTNRTDGKVTFISSRTVSDRTHTLLDDMTISELSTAIKSPVVPALTFSDVINELKLRGSRSRAA
jgi:putative radical SAM enzyme (TIGR03279 family)